MTAPSPPTAWLNAFRGSSAYSGATTARNWPSLAMCKRIEAQQFASAANGVANRNFFFEDMDAQPAVARQFIQRCGNAAAGGVAHPANAGSGLSGHGLNQGKYRTRVGAQICFEVQFAARQQDGDAVIADRAGKQNLVAGPNRARIDADARQDTSQRR